MPPPINPEVPRDTAARHRRERKQFRAEYASDLAGYFANFPALVARQAKERAEVLGDDRGSS